MVQAVSEFQVVADYKPAGDQPTAIETLVDTGVPVALGVLTCDDVEQALDRAGGAEGNKGCEAALAALEMARLLPSLEKAPVEAS